MTTRKAILALFVAAFLAAACGGSAEPTPTPGAAGSLPNEASEYCLAQGGQLEAQAAEGEAASTCLFADGSRCELWAYYRGECGPENESPGTGLANPASVHCEEQGYTLEMRTGEAGTSGYCLFPDGTECEEWAFFRGECGPGTPGP